MSKTRLIPLQNGGETIVDEDDYVRFSGYRWFKSTAGYVHRQGWFKDANGKRKHWHIWLHREINQTPLGLFTDHVNRNKLDNRKANLRTATKAQNAANAQKLRGAARHSQFKGVTLHKPSGLWQARLYDGEWRGCTYHKCETEAALSYNRMAKQRFGQFAKINTVTC